RADAAAAAARADAAAVRAAARAAAYADAAAARAAAAARVAAADAAARAAAYADAAWFWKQVSQDCTFVEAGGGAEDLAQEPVNLGPIVDIWHQRQLRLSNVSYNNWDIWIDWYKDRLNGAQPDPRFDRALLSITKQEWELPVGEVNRLLKERMGAGRGPAVAHFDFARNKIIGYAKPFDREAAAADLHRELQASISGLVGKLSNQAHPDIDDVVEHLQRVLTLLGDDVENAQATRLLQQLENLAADRHLLPLIADGNTRSIFEVAAARLGAIEGQLRNFIAAHDPSIMHINIAAEALDLRADDVGAVERNIDQVIEEATASEVVDESALEALQFGRQEIEELAEKLEKVPPQSRDVLNQIESDRRLAVARSGRIVEGFLSLVGEVGNAAKKGILTGVEKNSERAVTAAFVALATALFGKVGAFAAIFATASSGFATIKNRFEDLLKKDDDDPEENDGVDDA
ncbi:MAG: hypothetical protein AAFR21_16135, partial [Pseudomonadota bacterium]